MNTIIKIIIINNNYDGYNDYDDYNNRGFQKNKKKNNGGYY